MGRGGRDLRATVRTEPLPLIQLISTVYTECHDDSSLSKNIFSFVLPIIVENVTKGTVVNDSLTNFLLM